MLTASSPFTLVLFGASGHLATQKLYPALYVLALKKRLPEHYAVLGFARSAMDETSFRALVSQAVSAQMPEVTRPALEEFLTHCYYLQGQYDRLEDFQRLQGTLEQLEQPHGAWVRLAYLSIPPTLFTAVLRNLCAGHIHDAEHPFRCIMEKPVGHDLQS